jgi:hypothetical protein
MHEWHGTHLSSLETRQTDKPLVLTDEVLLHADERRTLQERLISSLQEDHRGAKTMHQPRGGFPALAPLGGVAWRLVFT